MTEKERKKILVVDDNQRLLTQIQDHFKQNGYEVHTTRDIRTASQLVSSVEPDLVILDLLFPDATDPDVPAYDGMDLLHSIREWSGTPVLILSVIKLKSMIIKALSDGADDYLAKPFDMEELCARVEAILRRTNDEPDEDKTLELNRLCLDPGERQVWKDGKPIRLTKTEFDLLYSLARRPEHVFTRDKLLDIAWEEPSFCVPKVVDVHIRSIRRKIEDNPGEPVFVKTVRGIGYRLVDAPQKAHRAREHVRSNSRIQE